MTKEEIISRTRDELADNGVTYYSTQDLSDSFDDGYEEICVMTGVLERMGLVTLVDNTVYYNLYEGFLDYVRPFAIWNPDIGDWMSQKSDDFFRKFRSDWEKAKGNSYRFSVIDFQYIALFPHKTTANDTQLQVYYNAKPLQPIQPYEVPEIPEQFQVAIQYYIMQDLFPQSEEFTKASLFLERYAQKLEELSVYVDTRSHPDRLNILKEQFSGGSFYGE